MSPTIPDRRFIICLLCVLAWAFGNVHAESPPNPDWPCEQILVTEIPPAVVWDGPSLAELQESWRGQAEVAGLVKRLTSSDYDLDDADREIGEFAARQDPAQKDHRLTQLFAGVIETLNEVRSKELDGIMRYARGQSVRADRLSEDLDQMVRLQDDPSQEAQQRLALMQSEMELKQRMFDEREAFIQHLCTRPAVVEQKLGQLARTIAYYLD